MPNSYRYFESGEVSHERLLLEIELLKQLQQADLLQNLDWKSYDTSVLKSFLRAGIREANNELTRRHTTNLNEFKKVDFISQCIEKHQRSPIKEKFKQPQTSLLLIFNTIFIVIFLFSIIGFFVYENIKFNHQHQLLKSLNHPLTAKRRQLAFTDDLSVILLTFASAIILGYTIAATRSSRKLILFGILALLIIVVLLITKVHSILLFFSKYRELRWPMVYDYLYS